MARTKTVEENHQAAIRRLASEIKEAVDASEVLMARVADTADILKRIGCLVQCDIPEPTESNAALLEANLQLGFVRRHLDEARDRNSVLADALVLIAKKTKDPSWVGPWPGTSNLDDIYFLAKTALNKN